MFKFEVGDRVRVTSEYQFANVELDAVGKLGTVTKVGDVYPYRVRMDEQEEDFDWHMFEEELEHVSEG